MNRMYITDEEFSYVLMGLDALVEADVSEAEYTHDEELRTELHERIDIIQDLIETLQWRAEEVKCG